MYRRMGDGVGVWMTIFGGARTLGFQWEQEGIRVANRVRLLKIDLLQTR